MNMKGYEIRFFAVGTASKGGDAILVRVIDENDATHIVIIDGGYKDDGDRIVDYVSNDLGLDTIILSRIGSVVIEGIMKKFCWLKKYDVNKYINKRKDNDLVETILSFANLYRTLSAAFLALPIISLIHGYNPCEYCAMYLMYVLLLILFISSFYKQYNYFCNAVEK